MATARVSREGASRRMAAYRDRMRAAGLRPVQIWTYDTLDPAVLARCREQAACVAAGDPEGEAFDRWIEATCEWPEP